MVLIGRTSHLLPCNFQPSKYKFPEAFFVCFFVCFFCRRNLNLKSLRCFAGSRCWRIEAAETCGYDVMWGAITAARHQMRSTQLQGVNGVNVSAWLNIYATSVILSRHLFLTKLFAPRDWDLLFKPNTDAQSCSCLAARLPRHICLAPLKKHFLLAYGHRWLAIARANSDLLLICFFCPHPIFAKLFISIRFHWKWYR